MLRTEAKTKTDNGEQGVIVVLRILQSMKRRNMMIDGLIPNMALQPIVSRDSSAF
jgi:hypothetical protein